MHRRNLRLPASTLVLGAIVGSVVATVGVSSASAEIVADPIGYSAADAAFELTPVGSYDTRILDESAAEIVTYFAAGQRMLVVNAAEAKVEVLSISDPANPVKLFDLQTTGILAADGSTVPAEAVANSVAVRPDGLGAIAVESDPKTDDGWVVFFDAAGDGAALGAVRVGALPDSLLFTPDGSRIVVANEGEPADDYSVDPEGTVSIIDAPTDISAPLQAAVRVAGFHAFEAGGTRALPAGIRIFGGREDAGTGIPEFPVSENLEPEYETVSADSTTAWITLQEANGLAEIDLASATVVGITDLGTVDRMSVPFDASDRDDAIAIRSWPVTGFRMPDTIDSYEADGATYLVTANEGDSRDWEGYSEVSRVADLAEDGPGAVCADALAPYYGIDGLPADLDGFLADEALGRLNVTTANGFDPESGCFSQLFTFGSRSFSIFDDAGALVWDSGTAFEEIVAAAEPAFFNSNHTESGFDGRSDDKGPEPEGLAIGEVAGRTYAFIGFERVGGIAAFDITSPLESRFVTYINNRDFAVSAEDEGLAGAGDLGPEGLSFISAEESPTGVPMIAVGNEVSGSTTLLAVESAVAPTPSASPEPTPSATPDPTPTPTPTASSGAASGTLPATGAAVPGALGAAMLFLVAGAGVVVARRLLRRTVE